MGQKDKLNLLDEKKYVESKKLSPARSALYRFGVIHKEISIGSYPNSSDLAAILEVSTKTVLRDVDIMRCQFGFPIKYDKTIKGFFYDTTTKESFDLFYWQSIFSRMTRFAESGKEKLTVYCHFIEPESEYMDCLKRILEILSINGTMNVLIGRKKVELTPVSMFKSKELRYVIFASQYEYDYFRVNINECVYDDKKKLLTISDKSIERVFAKGKSASNMHDCFGNGKADACICCMNGTMRTCVSPEISKFSFSKA